MEKTKEERKAPVVRNALTRTRVAKHFTGPSLAKQSFQNECDINTIMRKFEKNGLIDHLNTYNGEYGNFIPFADYHTSLNTILAADEAFASIPSSIRTRFDNDPAKFLEFAQNQNNLDQMIEMGLAPPRPREDGRDDPPQKGEGNPQPSPKGAPDPLKPGENPLRRAGDRDSTVTPT